MSFDPATVLDLDRYPLHEPGSPAGRAFLEGCRRELEETGACNLQGFVRPNAVEALAAEARELAPLAYRKDTRRTAYFNRDEPERDPGHPRRTFFPLKMSQTANDLIPKAALIQQLYEWQKLTDFIRVVVGREQLYRMADPYQALNLTYLGDGDVQPWHYDHGEFVVTLLLQSAEKGGAFEYAPAIRTPEDENFEGVRRLFAGTWPGVRTMPRAAGTLTIFRGEYAMHRVSPVEGSRQRITAVFSYDSLPDRLAEDHVNLMIYGPRLKPLLEGRASSRT